MDRRLKKLIYGLFYFIILSLIGFWFYSSFLKPRPSCFDKIRNQDEEGVDCGGICGQLCFPEDFQELKVTQEKIFPIDSEHLTLFAEIRNSNLNFAAKNFKYTFNVYNTKNEIIKTLTSENFIFENDTSYLLFPNLNLVSSSTKSLNMIIEDVSWVKAKDFKKPNFSISETQISLDENYIKVSGLAANQTPFDAKNIKIIVVLYDNLSRPIGASMTTLDDLVSNTTRPFRISHPPLDNFKKENYKIFISAPAF